MIAYLKGKILAKENKGTVLLAGQIGYFVHMTSNMLESVNAEHEIELFIHSHIREDAFDLYGFQDSQEMAFFRQLISISGIGPKVALEILNVDTAKIKGAIVAEDSAALSQIPGIGAKTAKRIILELKNKIDLTEVSAEALTATTAPNQEVIDALLSLGYQRREITHRLKSIPENLTKTEDIITYFLKNA